MSIFNVNHGEINAANACTKHRIIFIAVCVFVVGGGGGGENGGKGAGGRGGGGGDESGGKGEVGGGVGGVTVDDVTFIKKNRLCKIW